MTASAGATATVNGGKLKTTNPGVAGTFINTNIIVTLGAAGGTFEHVTTNILNIVQEVGGSTNGVGVTGPGGLTKEGIGVLAVACAMNYAGPTIINNGELRMRTSPNRLPTNTALIVNSAGILNLNNINTTVGSLAGSGRVGFGTGTLFINQDTDTVFTGQLLRVANYGAGGVTSGSGRISKSGSGSLTLAGTNDLTGSITNFAGAINVPPGAVLCDPILDLYIHGGTLNMSNAQQIVLSLRGTNDGVVNLGPGHTLIVSNSSSATFVGSITGPGNLVKTNTGTWALMGNNTFDGNFFIRSGVLIASNATSLGSSAGFTEVAVPSPSMNPFALLAVASAAAAPSPSKTAPRPPSAAPSPSLATPTSAFPAVLRVCLPIPRPLLPFPAKISSWPAAQIPPGSRPLPAPLTSEPAG
jgi:autotransporter-associated beta strand protein